MKLLIIRHGQSEADGLNVCEGRADFSLTKKGREDAAAMAKYLTGRYNISRIYTSPLLRARETALEIARHVDCPLDEADELMEFNNGSWRGVPTPRSRKGFR